MMKKMLVVVTATILVLLCATASLAQPPDAPFAWFDFRSPGPDDSSYAFVDVGAFDRGAAVSGSDNGYGTVDSNSGNYCYFNWQGANFTQRELMLKVYDGPGDESFFVEIKNPHRVEGYGTVYSFEDDTGGDAQWSIHQVYKFPFGVGKGQNTAVTIRIVPAAGSNAPIHVDWIALYEDKQPTP